MSKNGIMLQYLIGVDKHNPIFTVFRDEKKHQIQVYYGAVLYEILPDDKENAEYKMMIARLFNSGVKAKSLIKHFGYCYKTLERWGDALKSGKAERILEAFSGQGAPKKITVEIVAFINHDFDQVYPRNKYSYSQEIRGHIKKIYNTEISSEALRPFFNKLKKSYNENITKKK